jgi:hypothetical protein
MDNIDGMHPQCREEVDRQSVMVGCEEEEIGNNFFLSNLLLLF